MIRARDDAVSAAKPVLATVLDRNIRKLCERRVAERIQAPLPDRIADRVTAFTGSMIFVAIHLLVVAAWVAVNTGLFRIVPVFDPTFVILATVASVEAIFLSTFVLISQNRAAAAADRRADLDLQISLLAEHEITQLVNLTRAIAERLGVSATDPALDEAGRPVAPEQVLDRIESHEGAAAP